MGLTPRLYLSQLSGVYKLRYDQETGSLLTKGTSFIELSQFRVFFDAELPL